MVVVDTNIVAYLLIEGDRTESAQLLYKQDSHWRSEAFLLIEFSNILATYQRNSNMTAGQAMALLNEAEKRLLNPISVPHTKALQMAQLFSVSAYDARFLAAAEILKTRLITEDSKLRTSAPLLTQSLDEAITESP